MTLPYKKDDGQRRYACFCCGRNYEDFGEFKAHIIEKHEFSKEYVLCPLERCGAPVRDLRLHFKAKHPHDKCPHAGPIKAMIWKDQGTGKRSKRNAPREGIFISNKNGGREIKYRSGFECEILECLEAIPDIVRYDYEPFTSGIPYLFEGDPHKYHPDLSLQFSDGHVEVWEIKPANQTDLPVNQAKWIAADEYCKIRGWDFIVITETGLGKLRQRIKRAKAEAYTE